jgi:hypothetical protein
LPWRGARTAFATLQFLLKSCRRATGIFWQHEQVTAIDWLLGSDPSIRWQVLRDLTDASADEVAAERARVASEGAGASLLARQEPDGHWDGGTSGRDWGTLRALLWLRGMGLDPASDAARRAITAVRDHVTWQGVLPQDAAWHGRPLFAGEVEPCINGRVVAVGAYFGQDVQVVVDRLLGEQMADGGWNCEQENGSTRGSFNTTINVVEGLLEHEIATGGTPMTRAARLRGEEYILERRLFRRLSTGEVADPDWLGFSFPTGYHYDALRGLEYLRTAGVVPDERIAEAIALVESKRDADGRWPLEKVYEDEPSLESDEREGRPSRWITLRALRVLRWAEASSV